MYTQPRRHFLIALGAGAMSSSFSREAAAQAAFPERPITLVVPYGAGTSPDVWARLIARHMTTVVGQPIVIDNKAGAGGIVGAKQVASSKPDGYTLLVTGSAQMAVVPAMVKNPPYDSTKEFTPIGLAGKTQTVLVSGPSTQATTIEEFIAAARKKGDITMGYVSPFSQLAIALLKNQTGLNITPVPYKGSGELAADLIGGRIDCVADAVLTAMTNIQTGKVRPLAVFSATRAPQLPNVPTFAEKGQSGMEFDGWFGIVGPANLPPEVVKTLNAALRKSLAAAPPSGPGSFLALSMTVAPSSSEEMRDLIARDITRYGQLAARAGIERT